ncbi:hypothetical protein C4579_03630 [Candidatus Microgenomates bacterium]|nr:MAG: hypothetical protein C4579_03630 [Candidatus Microgenomates bacterium]
MKTDLNSSSHLFRFQMHFPLKKYLPFVSVVLVVLVGLLPVYFGSVISKNKQETEVLASQLSETNDQLASVSATLTHVTSEDQFVKNKELEEEIKNIQTAFNQSLQSYEDILSLREKQAKVTDLEGQFSEILDYLAKRNYASASATLTGLQNDISALESELAAAVVVPESAPVSNSAPAAGGYNQQAVETEIGKFLVDILAADLNSTRVIVETASSSDCADNCPVDSLASYVAKSGGFAGINGPYFCPAEYPSCAGKSNSFDTLLMNKNKYYFNSDNNVYSSVPAVIFNGSSARFVGASSEWGRDTSVDAVIAAQPMLLSGGNITFGGDGDPKKGSRGSRSFIGTRGSSVYIGVVRGATVAEVSYVLKALGLEFALNLDSGGSTAFYVNGRYVAGPGRNTPFGIVLVRK